MNVYDFDKTIYDGDSTLDFYLYSIKKNPLLLRYFPKQICGAILYKLGRYTKVEFKESFFCFFKGINNIDEYVTEFWSINSKKIKMWYLDTKKDSDIIISASPEFLLEPICKELEVEKLIASIVDKSNGKFTGENCYGEEKVLRLNCEISNANIEEFYSDSLTDTPLAKLAEKSFLVKGNKLTKWI